MPSALSMPDALIDGRHDVAAAMVVLKQLGPLSQLQSRALPASPEPPEELPFPEPQAKTATIEAAAGR